MDIIRTIKGFEKEFLNDNLELYNSDKIEFLKKRDEFISEKIEEMKKDEEE